MLATADFWTVSGWIVAVGSAGLALWSWVSRRFVEKEMDSFKSHLKAIVVSLESLRTNIAESHTKEDIAKTAAGRRLLSSLADQTVGIRNQALVALNERLALLPQATDEPMEDVR